MSGLRLEALSVRAGSRTFLAAESLALDPGRVVAVTGPPASGKSLLLQTLAAERLPAAGTVTFDGLPVDTATVQESLGYMAQTAQVLDALTATENVVLPLLARRRPAAEAWASAEQQLERLDVSAATRHNLAEQLSGGQRQRVAFARATVHRPRLLVADDPTSELDPVTARLVLAVLRELAGRGSVVVIATTDPEVAAVADQRIDLSRWAESVG